MLNIVDHVPCGKTLTLMPDAQLVPPQVKPQQQSSAGGTGQPGSTVPTGPSPIGPGQSPIGHPPASLQGPLSPPPFNSTGQPSHINYQVNIDERSVVHFTFFLCSSYLLLKIPVVCRSKFFIFILHQISCVIYYVPINLYFRLFCTFLTY